MIIQNGKQIANFSRIDYIEGVSDGDAYIEASQIVIWNPEAPAGYENIIIALMYYDPNIKAWCNCTSYKASGGGKYLITGGPSYGVAVVVGGTDCYRCAKATWRCYYITQEIIK